MTAPLDCVTYLLRMTVLALASFEQKSTMLVRAICWEAGCEVSFQSFLSIIHVFLPEKLKYYISNMFFANV